jgi:hypothetical protein
MNSLHRSLFPFIFSKGAVKTAPSALRAMK